MARRPSRAVSGWTGRGRLIALEVALPVVLVALWWAVSSGSTSLYYPPLSATLSELRHVWLGDRFASDALPSLEHLALGYVLAVLAGVVLGVAVGLRRGLSRALTPLLETLRAVPAIALVPAAVLVFGIGSTVQVVVIATSAVWPVLLNAVDGVRAVDPLVGDVARTYRISPWQQLIRMTLPAAGPQIVAGMRTAVSIAVVAVVVGEIIGATHGIGYQLLQAQRSFDIPGMWAAMVLLGLLGYVLNLAFRGFERLVLGWHIGMNRARG
jgi:sulfonate transport system permease protein